MDWSVFQVPVLAGVMMLLDIIVGFAGAIKHKDVQSNKLRDGLWHKAGFVGLIALAYVIQYAAEYVDLGFEVLTVIAVCAYVILTEIVSVFENLCVLNPHLVNSPLGALFAHTEKVEEAKHDSDIKGGDSLWRSTSARCPATNAGATLEDRQGTRAIRS